MEYELRLTAYQLDSLEKLLFEYVKHDCQQVCQMIMCDNYSAYYIERHGNTCSDIGVLLSKIKKSRESGKQ